MDGSSSRSDRTAVISSLVDQLKTGQISKDELFQKLAGVSRAKSQVESETKYAYVKTRPALSLSVV